MSIAFLKRFEQAVFYILAGILAAYIVIEIVELVYQFLKALISSNEGSGRLLITKDQTQLVLPVFFNILIAVELIDTFSFYVKEHSIKVQSVLLIGLMALGRKLLTLDVGHADGISNIGLAALILSLAFGFYLVKKVSN
ncbi:MAG: phosphate-starvation-inducible PsiE family protein [Bacteroidales bacterium]|nr:phosphate-starvation-inducible PsiE family protein [Bacteroidales bacterium]